MWFFCTFNTNNLDYTAGYYEPYIDSSLNYFEPGYRLLNILSYKIGISFFAFRMIMMTIVLLLLGNSILAYAKRPISVLLLYLCFPYLVECVQIRNAMSTALIIFALRYLAWNNLKGVLIYIMYVIFAMSFHKSSIAYILFIFSYRNSLKNVWKFSLIIFGVEYILILKLGDQIIQWMYNLTGEGRLLYYMGLNEGRILGKGMLPFLSVGVVLLYLYRKNKLYNPRSIALTLSNMDIILFKTSIITLVFIPLYLIDGNYIRLCTFMLPTIYITIINFSVNCTTSRFRKLALNGYCGFLAIVLFVFYIGPLNQAMFEGVTKAIFYNNAIWEWLGR